jgi:hypothetical protein
VKKTNDNDILCRLRDGVRKKHPKKWRHNSWFLLQGNASAHLSVLDKFVLAKNNVTTLEHTQYSADLASSDFYLFSRLKSELKERHFFHDTDIIKNATVELKRLA